MTISLNTNSVKKNMIVKDSTDYNECTEFGFYSISNGLNSPDSNESWFNLIVLPINNDEAYVSQLAIPMTIQRLYIRVKHHDSWTDWVCVGI